MSLSAGAVAFKLSFAISPIIMTGGIASLIPGGALPLLSLSNALSFADGILSPGSDALGMDDYFAQFQPIPGGTLIEQQIGMYPFANQAVAANAVIQQPLTISMLMICPANNSGGYATKLATMMAIQSSLDQHNKSGGTYTIMTPSFAYTDCVMLSMTDVSSSQTKQVQNAYKLDFIKPLVTLADAQNSQNALMSKISDGLPTDGNLSGANSLVGSTVGGFSPSVVASGVNSASSGISANFGPQ